jgi:excisionase family DNA binding protein
MAHPEYLREKARSLRISKKLTIDEIAERLALSRTTIYYWVRDLRIPGSGPGGEFPESARRLGNLAMQAKYRRIREEAYEEGRFEFARLSLDPTFRDFICMYIGEGFKRNRNRVSIANSDPAVVKLANRWIRRFAASTVHYAVQYHADQDLAALTQFWGNELDVEPEKIVLQRKSNSNGLAGRMWRSKYGVLTVIANDTAFRARLEAWIDCLKATWLEPEDETVRPVRESAR